MPTSRIWRRSANYGHLRAALLTRLATGLGRAVPLAVLTLLASIASVSAMGSELESGPEPGKATPPLKVLVSTGSQAGQDVDLAAARKEPVTVFAFVQADQFDRPMARLLKKIDTDLADVTDAAVIAVWLTDDVNRSHEYLPKAQQSLQFNRTTLAVHRGGKEGPDGWNLDVAARCSLIVARGGRVVARFGWKSLNETNAPAVLDAVRK